MVAERDVMKTLNPKDILIKAKLNLTLQVTGNSPMKGFRKRDFNRKSMSIGEQ